MKAGPSQPGRHRVRRTGNVVSWLDAIAAGRGVGTTAAATAYPHPRPDVIYRPVTDGPRIPVRLAWWRNTRTTAAPQLTDTITRLYNQ